MNRKVKIAVIIAIILGGIIGGYLVYINYFLEEEFRGIVREPEPALDFTLINQHGEVMSLSDLKGRVIALSFVYTHCPDICPAITWGFSTAYETLKEWGLADKVAMVLVSVDPERDTIERLQWWADKYGAENIIFFTGDPGAVAKVWEDYGIYVKKVMGNMSDDMGQMEHEGYLVEHAVLIYVIDKDFNIRVVFIGAPPTWSPDDLANDIRILARK
jgi:protein SCO1/2